MQVRLSDGTRIDGVWKIEAAFGMFIVHSRGRNPLQVPKESVAYVFQEG